jgi:methionyl aminopeptidase
MRVTPDINNSQFAKVQQAANVATGILQKLAQSVRPGITTQDIDDLAGELCKQADAKPAFVGQRAGRAVFNSNLCISVNDVVLHGVPNKHTVLQSGDLVKLDFGIIYQGVFTDQCVTVAVEQANAADLKLMQVAKMAIEAGAAKAVAGNSTGDIGSTIQTLVEAAGFNVLKEFVGHGIGGSLHESPEIPAYGTKNTGATLQIGDLVCVEAQVVAGSDDIFIAEDGWSVCTEDGKKGVMFEYMLCVGANAPLFLTDTRNWPLIVANS